MVHLMPSIYLCYPLLMGKCRSKLYDVVGVSAHVEPRCCIHFILLIYFECCWFNGHISDVRRLTSEISWFLFFWPQFCYSYVESISFFYCSLDWFVIFVFLPCSENIKPIQHNFFQKGVFLIKPTIGSVGKVKICWMQKKDLNNILYPTVRLLIVDMGCNGAWITSIVVYAWTLRLY